MFDHLPPPILPHLHRMFLPSFESYSVEDVLRLRREAPREDALLRGSGRVCYRDVGAASVDSCRSDRKSISVKDSFIRRCENRRNAVYLWSINTSVSRLV